MGDDSRPKRILGDLSSALRRDLKIDEFDFIPCPEPVVNRSPVVLENHKLGLQTWSIKLLYNLVYHNLLKRTAAVKDLKSLHEYSSAALLLNPECYTIWNMRKELVSRRFIKAEDDLRLATLIQTKHPKSPETFIQRRWLLQQLFPSAGTASSQPAPRHPRPPSAQANGNSHQSVHHSNDSAAHFAGTPVSPNDGSELTERHRWVVRGEMEACQAAASRYFSNYNAWSHRIWVLQHVARLDTAILLEELEDTQSWVKQHISDHSGFSYRHFVLQSLSSAANHPHEDVTRLIHKELVFTSRLIQSFPGHEAIWYHRRSTIDLGRFCLQMTRDHIHVAPTLNHLDYLDCNIVEGMNGHDSGDDVSDAESAMQGEKEWLLLKDFSNASSPMDPITAKNESADCVTYDAYECAGEDSTGCGAEALALLLRNEALFLVTVHKKTCKADRPLQRRCIDRHEKWLENVQY